MEMIPELSINKLNTAYFDYSVPLSADLYPWFPYLKRPDAFKIPDILAETHSI